MCRGRSPRRRRRETAADGGSWHASGEPARSRFPSRLPPDGSRPCATPDHRPVLAVAGNGMVGHHFLEAAVERGLHRSHQIVVLGEERRCGLRPGAPHQRPRGRRSRGVAPRRSRLPRGQRASTLLLGQRAEAVDPAARTSRPPRECRIAYDHLVLATGSAPFVPPVPGKDLAGVFVYRTLDDVEAIRAWANVCERGVVIGGGLLGLEAAGALRALGVHTTVVELAGPGSWPCSSTTRAAGPCAARSRPWASTCVTGAAAAEVTRHPRRPGRRTVLRRPGRRRCPAARCRDRVFAAGIRPRDELARAAGLVMGERGGVAVDDTLLTSDPHISAIGEVAAHRGGRPYGLVAPGYRQADVGGRTAGRRHRAPSRAPTCRPSSSCSGSTWRASATASPRRTEGAEEIVLLRPGRRGLQEARALGGRHPHPGRHPRGRRRRVQHRCSQYVRSDIDGARPPGAAHPARSATARRSASRPGDLPDAATICSCHNVTKGAICSAIDRRRPGGRRGHQGLHQGGHRLRQLRAGAHRPAARPAAQSRAKRLCCGCASTSARPGPSCSRSCGSRASARSPS